MQFLRWLSQLRKKCSSFIKKAKSEYYLSVTTERLNNPRKLWKVRNSLSVSKSTQALPTYVLKDSVPVYDRMEILTCFNKQFMSSFSLFDSVGLVCERPICRQQESLKKKNTPGHLSAGKGSTGLLHNREPFSFSYLTLDLR